MPTAEETMSQAQALLKEGKVQEAHDLLAEKVANPDPPPPPPPPTAPAIVATPIPAWVSDAKLAAGFLGELLPLLESFVVSLGSKGAHVTQLQNLKSLHAGLSK